MFLLSAQQAFVLASDLAAAPIAAATLFLNNETPVVQLGDGLDCFQIGGFVALDPVSGRLLADVLPPLIQIRATAPQAAVLHWLVDQLVSEQTANRPGAALVSAQLAQLLFVQILRAHLETSAPLAAGLLRAISDPLLAPALRLMHHDPGHPWQLHELAHAAAMSRTTFALRFKEAAGVPPLTYLTR